MTLIHEKSVARELALQTRLHAVLVALIDAASAPSFVTISPNAGGFAVHEKPIGCHQHFALPQSDCAKCAEGLATDAGKIAPLRTALDKLDSVLMQCVVDARNLDSIGAYLPTALDSAVLQMLSAEAEFEEHARAYVERLGEWQSIVSLTERVRHAHFVSDRPRYDAHIDRCVDLHIAATEAEVERDVARERVTNARTLVNAMVACPMLFMRTREQERAIATAERCPSCGSDRHWASAGACTDSWHTLAHLSA